MSRYVVGRVKSENGDSLRGKRILIIGIAYKPDVADVRESPAELIIRHLIKEGAIVSWHDEVVANWKNEISAPLSGADIAIVVTKHSSVDELKILNSAPYVFDTTGKIKGARSI
jgi:UDP-N-acetyl-D-glucosamine dehydrogenase